LRECRLLDPEEFSKPGDETRLAGWLKQVALGQDPKPPVDDPGDELWARPGQARPGQARPGQAAQMATQS
jgi:hypothetical protein